MLQVFVIAALAAIFLTAKSKAGGGTQSAGGSAPSSQATIDACVTQVVMVIEKQYQEFKLKSQEPLTSSGPIFQPYVDCVNANVSVVACRAVLTKTVGEIVRSGNVQGLIDMLSAMEAQTPAIAIAAGQAVICLQGLKV